LLDRGFYRVAVIRALQAARYPFSMPVMGQGRKPTHPQGPSGTPIFAAQQRRGGFTDTLTSANKLQATVGSGGPCRNWRGRRRRHGRQPLSDAFWGIRPKITQGVYQVYRERCGIETSYRPRGQACLNTTPRNPTLRVLFVGIALLLRHVWVWVHWR
jgi:putative transposase